MTTMNPIRICDINEHINNIDVIICSASFEERSLSVVNSIKRGNIKKRLLIYNESERNDFELCIKSFKDKKFDILGVDFKEPVDIIKKYNQQFSSLFTKKLHNVLLDITTFTHEGLLITLKFLKIYKQFYENLYIVYVTAKEYSVNEPDVKKKWLSKGIKRINSVLGYPGNINPSKENHLIILFGFEQERTLKLIQELDFNIISLGFGDSENSINYEHSRINKERHEELLQIIPKADKFCFSLREPEQAKAQIYEHILKYPNCNVVLAPMNNKLSTVGAALVSFEHPEIQICYAKAKEYNVAGYSSPSDECYLMNLEF
ncbi:hypothetical protein [Viscerimonas tarda]